MTRAAKKGYTVSKKNTDKPYIVQMWINGKNTYIGAYATPEEAIAVYRETRAKNPMLPAYNGFDQINQEGRNNPYMYEPEARCKFCGEYRKVRNMTRHIRSCKYANVDKIGNS